MRDWMAARVEDLLPAWYFHLVFTMPAGITQIAFWKKRAACCSGRRHKRS
ncbi:transposase zinc-binding domain-containing protein [Leisingera sp. HS039]|nr:transposase zinc-binding domain-containing protein [Leisingera sp. HS039]